MGLGGRVCFFFGFEKGGVRVGFVGWSLGFVFFIFITVIWVEFRVFKLEVVFENFC